MRIARSVILYFANQLFKCTSLGEQSPMAIDLEMSKL